MKQVINVFFYSQVWVYILQGCFTFKGKKSSVKTGKVKDELSIFTDEPWYKTYRKVLKKLEDQLKVT